MIAGNIMLTGRCNMNCPYCFSGEFASGRNDDISAESFSHIVDFIVGDGSKYSHVGIIGGEPTVHHSFGQLMEQLVNDSRIQDVDLFTNGLLLDRYIDILSNSKFHFLVNVNGPASIGEKAYAKIVDNIHLLKRTCNWEHVGLGINLFGTNSDYNYMIDLLDDVEMDSVRVSVTVPDVNLPENENSFEFFGRVKDNTLSFCIELLDRGIVPFFDCNKIPYCLLVEDEQRFLDRYKGNSKARDALQISNLFNGLNRCEPSIVIGQDLIAARCFGLSSSTRESIDNFSGMDELVEYYERSIDIDAYKYPLHEECSACEKRISRACMGGCLVFRETLG